MTMRNKTFFHTNLDVFLAFESLRRWHLQPWSPGHPPPLPWASPPLSDSRRPTLCPKTPHLSIYLSPQALCACERLAVSLSADLCHVHVAITANDASALAPNHPRAQALLPEGLIRKGYGPVLQQYTQLA